MINYEQELQEQLTRDRAFKRAHRQQHICFLKEPVVIKNGQRFRVATQSVSDEQGTVSQKKLVRA